jgi:hypothetical protein
LGFIGTSISNERVIEAADPYPAVWLMRLCPESKVINILCDKPMIVIWLMELTCFTQFSGLQIFGTCVLCFQEHNFRVPISCIWLPKKIQEKYCTWFSLLHGVSFCWSLEVKFSDYASD